MQKKFLRSLMGLAKTTAVILLLTCYASQPAASVPGSELAGAPGGVTRAVRKLTGLVRDLDADANRCCGRGNPTETCGKASNIIFCPTCPNNVDEVVTRQNSDGTYSSWRHVSCGAVGTTWLQCLNGITGFVGGFLSFSIQGCDYCRAQAASHRAERTIQSAAENLESRVRASTAINDTRDPSISAKNLLIKAKKSQSQLQTLIKAYAASHGGWRPRGEAKATELSDSLLGGEKNPFKKSDGNPF